MWSYVGYEGDVGNTFEPVEGDEFLIFNNYHFMTMSMDYALATITGTYSYTVKEINEQGENNVSDIEYDPSVYTVTVNVDENMDMSITYTKNGTNVDNSSESVDGISFENKMSVTAAAIDPAVKKVLNNVELQPGEFTFQLFDENNNLIDTKKGRVKKLSFFHTPLHFRPQTLSRSRDCLRNYFALLITFFSEIQKGCRI